ncbi:MAG: hypothetical protein PHO62_10920 [Sulfurimonas sp.]|uniref:hypothetical protein n=1 Tax=Sulfurimonas sp. TaxID=2022749 RepID=UPI0026045CC0|nr:hypothetical protein [Sulfurimonas sp.]MDD5373922.1 hypothetical protein [Sulfurimonas sp.]
MTKKKTIAIEIHWWVKDAIERARHKGVDIITKEVFNYKKDTNENQLSGIVYVDSLDDISLSDAESLLSASAQACSGHDDSNDILREFTGCINAVFSPVDFGVSKIKKIRG